MKTPLTASQWNWRKRIALGFLQLLKEYLCRQQDFEAAAKIRDAERIVSQQP